MSDCAKVYFVSFKSGVLRPVRLTWVNDQRPQHGLAHGLTVNPNFVCHVVHISNVESSVVEVSFPRSALY